MSSLQDTLAARKARRGAIGASLLAAALVTLILLASQPGGGGGGSGGAVQASRAPCRSKALLPLKRRELMGALLEAEGFTTGAELGVQKAWFANITLSTWPSCKRYYLVDLWAHQENYVESANVDDGTQQQFMEVARARLAPWADRTTFLRMYTSEAALRVPDASLDYVYVDARHDYCGVTEDLVAWWPKVRPGGIFAGHDFIDAAGVKLVHPTEDWALCQNGERHEGAVEGAVRDFAQQHGLTVAVTYLEAGNPWKTWMVRKPGPC